MGSAASFGLRVFVSILAAAATLCPVPARAQPALLYPLTDTSAVAHLSLPLPIVRPEITRRRYVGARTSVLESRSPVALDLFGKTTVLEHVRSESHGTNRHTWIGRVRNDPGSFAAFVVRGDDVSGYVDFGGAAYELEPLGAGAHALSKVDLSAILPLGPPLDPSTLPIAARGPTTASRRSSTPPSITTTGNATNEDDAETISILVVYTPAAERNLVDLESTVELEIAVANEVFVNSGVTARLRLVGLERVEYSEHEQNMTHDLKRLWTPDDGHLDGVHALRDAFQADVVNLISDSLGYCGMALLLSDLGSENEQFAFNVTRWSCARLPLRVFTHELGHTLGAGHDHPSGCRGAFAHSCGHRHEVAPSWRTVMSYGCSAALGGCPVVPFFSNPRMLLDGVALGVAAGAPSAADNARTIDETAPTVASFRGPSIGPRLVSATTERFDTVLIDWSAATAPVAGYRVHRFASPSSKEPEMSWDVSSPPFGDPSGDFGTAYTYRVAGVTADAVEGAWSPRVEGSRVEPSCGRPVTGPRSAPDEPPSASDCLFLLGVTLGSNSCMRPCICDLTGTGDPGTSSKDVLLCLAAASGHPIGPLDCRCAADSPRTGRG
jgi:hypothetical protein